MWMYKLLNHINMQKKKINNGKMKQFSKQADLFIRPFEHERGVQMNICPTFLEGQRLASCNLTMYKLVFFHRVYPQ